MSERGVFAVDRGIWDHDLLADSEPFSRREAWLWLVSEAAWKPHRRRIIGRQIDLTRGQLVASTRFIASKWRWSEARVRRFLSALISEQMIDAKTDAGVSVITICKYDEYQRVSLPIDAMRNVDDDAGATQERRKVEDKEYKEKNGAEAPVDQKVEFFKRGREVLGPKAGGLLSKLLRSCGPEDDPRSVAKARARIEDASTKTNPTEWVGRILSPQTGGQMVLTASGNPWPEGIT